MGESKERCIRTPFCELEVGATVYDIFFLLKAEHIYYLGQAISLP